MLKVVKSGALVMGLFLLAGCPKEESEPVTYAEAKQSLEEASVSSQASDLTSSSIELSTNFTIGGAARDAAGELRTFIGSQLPCAEITLAEAKLTVKYGAKPGECTYRGHKFAGTHSIEVARNDEGDVQVDHTWTEFTNGVVKVDGTANVTWSKKDVSRRVVHTLKWTRLSDGVEGTGKGDRTQRPLAGGIVEGFRVDGSRSWDGRRGHWDLAISGVEMRWADPIPQAGTYTLSTPKGKTVSLSFTRLDENRIQATLASGEKSFKFVVSRAGKVDDA